jgi:hypothetical protein
LVGGAINAASATQFIGGTTISSTLVNWGLDAAGATWKYRDPSINLGSSGIVVGNASYNAAHWKHPQFVDTGIEWKSGDAELGATDAPRTAINVGASGARYPALYFRKKFTVTNPAQYDALSLEVKRDDGAIVYINGKEVGRTNMPAGDIAFDYIPNNVVGGTDEETFFPVIDPRLVPSVLVNGENVICVEVHQANSGSSDLTFDLRLQATKTTFPQPIFLTQPGLVTLKARSTNGTAWGPLTETQFVVNAVPASISNLVVSEIMYHPANPTATEIAAGFDNDDDFEFIELLNVGATAIDLINVRFIAGITFDFDQSQVSRFLNPGQRLILVSNPPAFISRHGNGLPVAGEFGGSLENAGETLTLVDATNGMVKNFTYGTLGLWPEETDGWGFSLVLKNPINNPDHGNPANWRSSVNATGNPNMSDATTFTAWRAANNLATVAGDADGDGIDHILEYALGTHPNQSDAHRLPEIGIEELPDGSHVTITFTQRLAADDCQWIPEAAPDLVNFQANLLELGQRTNNGDGTVTLTYRSIAPQTDASRLYLRVRAVVTPG